MFQQGRGVQPFPHDGRLPNARFGRRAIDDGELPLTFGSGLPRSGAESADQAHAENHAATENCAVNNAPATEKQPCLPVRKSVAEATDLLLKGLKKGKAMEESDSEADGSDESPKKKHKKDNHVPNQHGKKKKAAAKKAKAAPAAEPKNSAKSKVPPGQKYAASFESSIERVRVRCADGTSFSIKFADHGGAKKAMAYAQKWIKDHS